MKTLKALTSSLLLLSAAAALFVFVYQPLQARSSVREALSSSPGFEERLVATEGNVRQVSDAMDAVLTRSAALENFDAWRQRHVVILGRSVVPWERMMEHSQIIRLADEGVDIAIAAVDQLREIETAWDDTADAAAELHAALDALEAWPTRARVGRVIENAATLEATLSTVAAALGPIDDALTDTVVALDAAQLALDSGAGPAIGPIRAAVANALSTFDENWGQHVRSLAERVSAVERDHEACVALKGIADSWLLPPPSPSGDGGDEEEPPAS